jgi:ribosomal protein S18 acetylase RimI-like enzyme
MNRTPVHEAQAVRLRAATRADYEFARRVHHTGMRWLGERLHGSWDDVVQDARFKQKFVLEEVRIIVAGDDDAGYLQSAIVADDVMIKELHINEAFQNRGIGGQILRVLLAEARRIARPVVVTVVKFNPALAFYERAGFRIVSEQDQRFHLRHENQSGRSRGGECA